MQALGDAFSAQVLLSPLQTIPPLPPFYTEKVLSIAHPSVGFSLYIILRVATSSSHLY